MKLTLTGARLLQQKQFLQKDLVIWKAYSEYYSEKDHYEYRQRILYIQNLAEAFKDDPTIKDVVYTDSENQIWKTVFGNCMKEISAHGCEDYL
jgi:hypothetical protein